MRTQANKRIAKAIAGKSDNTLAKGIMKSQAFWMTSTDIVGDMFPSEINSDGVDISTGNLFADGTKIVAGCKGFKKACIVAFAAGHSSLLAESVSEPRTPLVGINSLGIKIPYFPLEEEQYSAKLSEAAFKYYLMISRGGLVTDPGPRLHLVSPCKATLTVEVNKDPVRCFFDKCVVPETMMKKIEGDCGGDIRCEDVAIEEYKADNCGYMTADNYAGQTKKIETKYPFYFFGNNLVEVKMNDEDMVLIDEVAPTSGLDYYRNRVDIYTDDSPHYIDISYKDELKDVRGTKICNTESVMEFTGDAVFGRVWDVFTLDGEEFFGLDSYHITNVIRVTADKRDYGCKMNYCYQEEVTTYAYGRIANMIGWAVLDTVVASAATRFGPWGLAAAAGSQFVTGATSVAMDQKLEDKSVTKWPGK